MYYTKIESDLPYKLNHFANVPVNKIMQNSLRQ